MISQGVCYLRNQVAKLHPRHAHQFSYCKQSHISSIVIGRANRRLVTEAKAAEEAAASHATATKRRSATHLQALADERCQKAGIKDVSGVVIDGGGEC
jgi:hypothetical protein